MNETQTVTVYFFQTLEGGIETAQMATYKTTRERINAMPSARVLEGTGEQIPKSELDPQERYRRIATGWGEL